MSNDPTPAEISADLIEQFANGEPPIEVHTYLLPGTFLAPGRALVHGVDLEEGLARAQAGEWVMADYDLATSFEWDGDVFYLDEDGTERPAPPKPPVDTRTGLQTVAEVIAKLEVLRWIEDDYDDQLARDEFLDSVFATNFDDAELALLRDLRDLI